MISCRTKPTRRFLSSASQYPPKTRTLCQKRRVFVLCVIALSSFTTQAQQVIGEVYASDASIKGTVRAVSSGLEVSNGSVITAGEQPATLSLRRGGQVR